MKQGTSLVVCLDERGILLVPDDPPFRDVSERLTDACLPSRRLK